MLELYELAPAGYAAARPLFAAATFDRAYIDGAFEDVVPSRLFVDHPEHPTAALLCRTFEYYVAGEVPAAALRCFIAAAPEEVGVFQDLYGYVPLSDAWRAALLADHPGPLEVIGRREFKYESPALPDSIQSRYRLPAGARLLRLDRALAMRVDRELQQFIGDFWHGYDRFLSHGFGFCLLLDSELVSVAYAAGASARFANIDIFTAEPHRRRGFSTRTSAAFIEHCLAQRLVPTWDTDDGNAASIATALRLGFTEHPSFCQISPPHGSRLALSHDRWQRAAAVPDAAVAAVWRCSDT